MRSREQLNRIFGELESIRTINITPELVKECSPILKEQYNYRLNEVEYMIILCGAHIFYNMELNYLIERYHNLFITKLSLESLINLVNFLSEKYKDVIEKYRQLSTINSFYKNALGYEYFETNYEYIESREPNDDESKREGDKDDISVYTPVLKKSVRKNVTSDKELLKILLNKYKVLDRKAINNINDLLIHLIKNNK